MAIEIVGVAATCVTALAGVIHLLIKRIDRLETRLDDLAKTVENEQRERQKLALAFERLRGGYIALRTHVREVARMLREGKTPDDGHIAQMEGAPTVEELLCPPEPQSVA